MHRPPSRRTRWALAVLLGIPGTVVFLPLAGLIAVGGFLALTEAFHDVPGVYSAADRTWNDVLAVAWGLGGLLGLVGFWSWALQPRWLSRPVCQWLVAGQLLGGLAAMAPVVSTLLGPTPVRFSTLPAVALLGALGVLAGSWVLYLQVRVALSARICNGRSGQPSAKPSSDADDNALA